MRSDRRRQLSTGLAALVPLVALGAACSSSPQSFVVLDLEHDPMEASVTQIVGITTIVVDVSGGTPQNGVTPMRTLTYDAKILDGGSLTLLDPPTLETLSVSFSGGEGGTVSFMVSAVNAQSCVVGRGSVSAVIRKGGIAEVVVPMDSANDCGGGSDGGAPDAAEAGVTFPGCDPVDPSTGTPMCAANQTCEVDCTTRRTVCGAADGGAPGSLCQPGDCAPGSQCFDYSGLGCAAKVCLRFCAGDQTCAAFGDGGAGPGSVCQGRVSCGGVDTSYHTCTFNCDPSAVSDAPRGGCPTGLACILFGAGDQVDCTCPAATQTKKEGEACTSGADCAPGLLCNSMGGMQVCRAVCPCLAVGGLCSTNADRCPTAGTHCTALTNNTRYGICL